MHGSRAVEQRYNNIDARLKLMEGQLLKSLSQLSQGVQRLAITPETASASKFPVADQGQKKEDVQKQKSSQIDIITFRVMKPGLMLQEENGELKIDLVVLDGVKIANAKASRRFALLEYIRGLRLITWLLITQNYLSSTEVRLNKSRTSLLRVNMGSCERRASHYFPVDF
jgi:hypothetical protein